ncbi:hypothetical protein [Microtetraspora malaysiensis]|uniref:hypothetical protein n=1 Tax=Microtetraspora malaysiensis TaxID=161358 RepID=UPI003D8DC932
MRASLMSEHSLVQPLLPAPTESPDSNTKNNVAHLGECVFPLSMTSRVAVPSARDRPNRGAQSQAVRYEHERTQDDEHDQ